MSTDVQVWVGFGVRVAESSLEHAQRMHDLDFEGIDGDTVGITLAGSEILGNDRAYVLSHRKSWAPDDDTHEGWAVPTLDRVKAGEVIVGFCCDFGITPEPGTLTWHFEVHEF